MNVAANTATTAAVLLKQFIVPAVHRVQLQLLYHVFNLGATLCLCHSHTHSHTSCCCSLLLLTMICTINLLLLTMICTITLLLLTMICTITLLLPMLLLSVPGVSSGDSFKLTLV
jgi:hypothetical protein